MLNSEFNEFSSHPDLNFYPEPLRAKIDEVNEWIYHKLNNGVYRSGFATSQHAYEAAVQDVFSALDQVESILSQSEFLAGPQFTEADIRLFTTIVRFMSVYHGHFKCNIKTLQEFPHVMRWTRRIYQMPGIAETVNQTHIKRHYYMSHVQINVGF